ncbi:MAG: HTTM domain-containing protein [Bacteroidia bacterium]|jgi:hypothetical protein|nr:HTTM domain-containing protein [Bacteroidia bacterium]
MVNYLNKYNYDVTTRVFAMFRIAFGIFLLLFIFHLNQFRAVLFNTFPELTQNPFPAKLFLLLWSGCVALIIIGWLTKIMAVANYILVLIAAFSFSNNGNGTFNDDLMRIGSFLLIFLPSNKDLSCDALLYTLKNGKLPQRTTSSLYVLGAIFVSLGLLYASSGITKLMSPIWLKGLGLWIPSVMPHNKWHDVAFYTNELWLMKALNYITIGWELFFLPALFLPKLRNYMALVGIFFHVGIALLFPFPLICVGPITFYVLFLGLKPNSLSNTKEVSLTLQPSLTSGVLKVRFLQFLNPNTNYRINEISNSTIEDKSIREVLKAELNCSRTGKVAAFFYRFTFVQLLVVFFANQVIDVEEKNTFQKQWIKPAFQLKIFVLFCFTLFAVQSFYTAYHINSRAKGAHHTQQLEKYYRIRRAIQDYSLKPSNLFRTFFGLNSRGVFLDHANSGVKGVFAVIEINKRDTIWLPFFNQLGYTGTYNMNLPWSKYTFNTVCSGTAPNPLELEKVLVHWASKQKRKVSDLKLQVVGRLNFYPTAFEINYLRKLQTIPWKTEAFIHWENKRMVYVQADSTKVLVDP